MPFQFRNAPTVSLYKNRYFRKVVRSAFLYPILRYYILSSEQVFMAPQVPIQKCLTARLLKKQDM